MRQDRTSALTGVHQKKWPRLSSLRPSVHLRQKNSDAASSVVSLWAEAVFSSYCFGFIIVSLYSIYLWFDLGVVVRLLLMSAVYRLVWMWVWRCATGLSPSPSDVSKLCSSGESSLKNSRLRERTVTYTHVLHFSWLNESLQSKIHTIFILLLWTFINSIFWFVFHSLKETKAS